MDYSDLTAWKDGRDGLISMRKKINKQNSNRKAVKFSWVQLIKHIFSNLLNFVAPQIETFIFQLEKILDGIRYTIFSLRYLYDYRAIAYFIKLIDLSRIY